MPSEVATMDLIVNEGRDRPSYPGASHVEVFKSIPEFRGGVTMTIRFPQIRPEAAAPLLTVDATVRGGVPSIGSQHLPIAHVLQRLASGATTHDIVQENPGLNLDDVQFALDVAAWVMRDPAIDWQSLQLASMVDFNAELQSWQSLSDDAIGEDSDSMGA